MTRHVQRNASTSSGSDEREIWRALVRLNARVLGFTFGILAALVIFTATMVLVIKGGPNVGAHLSLLGEFFFGYRVTFFGAFIGAGYGFLVGFFSGVVVAVIYNWVAYVRSR